MFIVDIQSYLLGSATNSSFMDSHLEIKEVTDLELSAVHWTPFGALILCADDGIVWQEVTIHFVFC